MTLQRLNEHYDLVQKLATAKEALVSLRTAAEPGAQRLTGMPHGTGTSDTVSVFAVQIALTEQRIEDLRKEIERSSKEINSWLSTIDRDDVRSLLTFRFLGGMLWKEAAACYKDRRLTGESARKLCSDYWDGEEDSDHLL